MNNFDSSLLLRYYIVHLGREKVNDILIWNGLKPLNDLI